MIEIKFETIITVNDDSSVERKCTTHISSEYKKDPQRLYDIMSSFLHEATEEEVNEICHFLIDYHGVKNTSNNSKTKAT